MHQDNSSAVVGTWYSSDVRDLLGAQSHIDWTHQRVLPPDIIDEDGSWYRVIDLRGTSVLVRLSPDLMASWLTNIPALSHDIADILKQRFAWVHLDDGVFHLPEELRHIFLARSPLLHMRSPSLFEALAKAIIRQVITAKQAEKTMRAFVQTVGKLVMQQERPFYTFPNPRDVLRADRSVLLACGLGYKTDIILKTAERVLTTDMEAELEKRTNEEAIEYLTQQKGIGRWTAGVVMAELRADWSIYPIDDLAVRTWAAKLWPDVEWPSNPAHFALMWQELHGSYVSQVTYYTLTLGPSMLLNTALNTQ